MSLLSLLPALSALPAQQLEAGAAAPALALAQMVRGEPVTKLDAGVVHLIEFWGSEAGVGFDRHSDFAKLQKAHGDKLNLLGVVAPSDDCDAIAGCRPGTNSGNETSLEGQ